MRNPLLDAAEKKNLKEKLPYFEVGDTVDVHCKIVEGEKSRTQIFTGVVISRSGRGMNEHLQSCITSESEPEKASNLRRNGLNIRPAHNESCFSAIKEKSCCRTNACWAGGGRSSAKNFLKGRGIKL